MAKIYRKKQRHTIIFWNPEPIYVIYIVPPLDRRKAISDLSRETGKAVGNIFIEFSKH